MANLWFLLKQQVAEELKVDVGEIEEPEKYGDFAYPCFNLAKKTKKNPNEIAKELAKKGKVYTKIIHREFKIYKKPRSKPFFIRGSIFKIFIKLIFDLNLMYYEANKDPRYGIDNKFLKRVL